MPQNLKNLETAIIKIMIRAHSSYYGRALTAGESKDCQATILHLQKEIESRKNEALKLYPK